MRIRLRRPIEGLRCEKTTPVTYEVADMEHADEPKKNMVRRALEPVVSLITAMALAASCAVPALTSPQAAEAAGTASSVQVQDASASTSRSFTASLDAPTLAFLKAKKNNTDAGGSEFWTDCGGQSTILIAEDGSCSKSPAKGARATDGDWLGFYDQPKFHDGYAGKVTAKHYTKVTFGYALTECQVLEDKPGKRAKLKSNNAVEVTVWIKAVEQDGKEIADLSKSRVQLRTNSNVDRSWTTSNFDVAAGFEIGSFTKNSCTQAISMKTSDIDGAYCLLTSIPLKYTAYGDHLAFKEAKKSASNNTQLISGSEYSRHRYEIWKDTTSKGEGGYTNFTGFAFNHGKKETSSEKKDTDFSMTVHLGSTGLLSVNSYKDEAETQWKHTDICWDQWLYVGLETVKGEKVKVDLDGGQIEQGSAGSLFDGTGMTLGNGSTITLPNPTREGYAFVGWAWSKGTNRSTSSDVSFAAPAGEGEATKAKDLSTASGALYDAKSGLQPATASSTVITVHNGWQGYESAAWNKKYHGDLPDNSSKAAEVTWRAVWAKESAEPGEHTASYYVNGQLVRTDTYSENEPYTVWSYSGLSSGQDFDGWYADGSSRSSAIAAGSKAVATSDMAFCLCNSSYFAKMNQYQAIIRIFYTNYVMRLFKERLTSSARSNHDSAHKD